MLGCLAGPAEPFSPVQAGGELENFCRSPHVRTPDNSFETYFQKSPEHAKYSLATGRMPMNEWLNHAAVQIVRVLPGSFDPLIPPG